MAVKVGLKFIEIWGESMEDEILAYEKEPIEKGKIVFYGPSYFTRWSKRFGMIPLSDAIRGASGESCIINRGFGSSCAEHQLYYYSRLIRPLEPKVLVYAPMGNYSSFGYSAEENWEIAQRVIVWAETDFPGIEIYLGGHGVSMGEPSFSKAEEIKRTNTAIKAFCDMAENRHFFNVREYEPFFGRNDIFVEDKVHFNQKGYDIYTEFFKEVLRDELKKY